MKRFLAVLAFCTVGLNAHAADRLLPPLECGDFLQQLGLSRPDVTFQGCTKEHEPGQNLDRLEATYRVSGKDLAHVEAWAIRTFHLQRLRFECCGWNSPSVSFKAKDGAYYEIGLGGEALENHRKDWPKVPFLTLTVAHYLNEP
jgi:hypothetical protein